MAYNFTAEWIKNFLNIVHDALSRYPVLTPQSSEILAEYDNDNELAATQAEITAVSCGKESICLQDL